MLPKEVTFHRNTVNMNRGLISLRNEPRLCDLVLVAGEVEIPAHRLILSACSPYFKIMFTSKFAEHSKKRIEIHDVDSEILQILVDFAYTGSIKLTEDNVQLLLQAANMFQIEDLIEAAWEFMQERLHPSNALGIHAFAKLYDFQNLCQASEDFMKGYFIEVVRHEEFLLQEANIVSDLISSPVLTVQREEQVLEALLTWVKYKSSLRAPLLSDLLKHVRLTLIPRGRLMGFLCSEDILKEDPACAEQFQLGMHKTTVPRGLAMQLPGPSRELQQVPRRPAAQPQQLFVFCGKVLTTQIHTFDFMEDTWNALPPMPTRRCRAKLVFVNDQLYVLGGTCGEPLRTTRVFDFRYRSWRNGVSMLSKRVNFGAVRYGTGIFVVGGRTNSAILNSTETFNPATLRWNYKANMNCVRGYPGVVVLLNRVYAIGGVSNERVLSSVEYFDPDRQRWLMTRSMNTERSGAGAGVIKDLLYVVGGWNGQILSSGEVHDPLKYDWTPLPPMTRCRRNPGVVVVNNKLIVIGGEQNSDSTTEFYDPKSGTWTMLTSRLAHNGRNTSVVKINKYMMQ